MVHIKLITSQKNEIEIEDISGLERILIELISQEPQIVLVEMPSFGIFTVGIRPQHGFLEYMDNSREPPYLMAISKEPPSMKPDFLVFDAGGTETQIPSIKCIPTELILQILIDTVERKGLPDYVVWEEV
jgi:Immunity protein Imm1